MMKLLVGKNLVLKFGTSGKSIVIINKILSWIFGDMIQTPHILNVYHDDSGDDKYFLEINWLLPLLKLSSLTRYTTVYFKLTKHFRISKHDS
jgi:hypothetical protein